MNFDGERKRIDVCGGEGGRRLDRLLAEKLREYSRSRIQAWIREGRVLLNGRVSKASAEVEEGDIVELTIPPVRKMEGVVPQKMDLEILYEDEFLVVLNKPAGLVVHPGAGVSSGTLVNGLLYYCKDLAGIGGVERPGIVHRLDKETSGCLVVAKRERIHQELVREFAGRRVGKVYLAVVEGEVKGKEGRVEVPIVRHPVYRCKMAALKREGARFARTD
ncbi:MAG: RluA family pseudouridine synthase, partial [Chthoniobacterales bacterium]|nr:RluA family pseudouridine synthase [Chthoniobacterales bacterium]